MTTNWQHAYTELKHDFDRVCALAKQARAYRAAACDAKDDVLWLQKRVRFWKEMVVLMALGGVLVLVMVLAIIRFSMP